MKSWGRSTVFHTGQALKIGKNYNITASINAENLELIPIEFDVIEVKEWVPDTALELPL